MCLLFAGGSGFAQHTEKQGHFHQHEPIQQSTVPANDPCSHDWSSILTSSSSSISQHHFSTGPGIQGPIPREGPRPEGLLLGVCAGEEALASISQSQPVLQNLFPQNLGGSGLSCKVTPSSHPHLQISTEPALSYSTLTLGEVQRTSEVGLGHNQNLVSSTFPQEHSPPSSKESGVIPCSLVDSSEVEHTSQECLLGNQKLGQDSETSESRSSESSVGLCSQSESSETTWCLDLIDWYDKRLNNKNTMTNFSFRNFITLFFSD